MRSRGDAPSATIEANMAAPGRYRLPPTPVPVAGLPLAPDDAPRVGIVRVRHATLAMAVLLGAALLSARQPPPPPRPTEQTPRMPDIYFAPTRHVVADAMLRLAGVGPDDVVYDLGSGDGRIVVLAAQKYGARGVGIEIDPRLVRIARDVAREGEVGDRVSFVEGDLFATDLSPATVVTLYLSPGVNRDLEPKLRRELRPGARIVSHQFPIGHWSPERTQRAEDGTDLFLWTVPDTTKP